MSKYKNMKIRTYGSEELSKAIQDKLFELGYTWRYGVRYLQYTKYPYILTGSGGDITYCDREFSFIKEARAEITIDELMQMKPEKRETIKIGDAVYDKEEFEEATKHLKPIED